MLFISPISDFNVMVDWCVPWLLSFLIRKCLKTHPQITTAMRRKHSKRIQTIKDMRQESPANISMGSVSVNYYLLIKVSVN